MGSTCLHRLMEEHRQGTKTTSLPCRCLQLSLVFSEMLKRAGFCQPSGLLCECSPRSITITARWQKMKFQKHFQKCNTPETKVGKFLIPVFQCGSNGSEHAGKCSSGRGSHSAVERGCLITARSACPQARGDGCARGTYAIKGLFRKGYWLS